MALILIGISPIAAQETTINSFLQNFDAEISIPEEDIFLINDILKGQWPLDKRLVEELLKLSVLDYNDEMALKKVRGEKTLLKLSENMVISEFLRQLVSAIQQTSIRNEQYGNLTINQYIVFNDDSRYRWRINYKEDNYSANLIAERDPNEDQLLDHVLDHVSGYFKKEFDSSSLIIGDYQIVSGFGLWSWRSVATRKSFETIQGLPRVGSGLTPYRSANEAWYIRGIGYAKETNLGNILLSLGYTKQDGRIDSVGNIHRSYSGFHTGKSSISLQDNITESVLLGQWNYDKNNTNVSTSFAGVNWSDSTKQNVQDWSGSVTANQSMKFGSAFTEIGRGYNNTFGTINGIRLNTPSLNFIVSARYYSQGYSASRSNPLAEWVGADRNEFGLFQSINYKHNKNNFTVYGDLYKSTSAEPNESFPRSGQEAGIRWEKRQGKNYQRAQWKWEKKSLESEGAFLLSQEDNYKIDNTIKYNNSFTINDVLGSKIQLIYSIVERNNAKWRGYGIDTQMWWNREKLTVYFDIVTTFIKGGSAWIYFWDVNLPNEMTTRVYTKDGISPAIKVMYRTYTGFELGFRVRAQWKEFDFNGTPEMFGALALEVKL